MVPAEELTQRREAVLPSLRQEISVQKGGASWTGAPTWLLYDGFRNKFFRIDLTTFEILSRWRAVPISKFREYLSKELGRVVGEQEIIDLTEFLFANSLTLTASKNGWRSYFDQANAQKRGWGGRILHNYLFFRVPLARPQKFIDFFWPFVSPLFTRACVWFFVILAILGLYLVQRQWQHFTATFLDFLTLDGLAIYGISLVGIKIIHELGHAFMARKYEVNVPVIGVAFIVLFPILYTDTTGATRLSNKKERLMIDLAGIFAELMLATIATILWVFLPDGPLRSVAFTTATLSWLLSLGVNLNPFMRFDGYYILSDIIGIENLQERGFALARWRLREILFGLGHKVPEILPKNWRRLVILHAWGTWIYRFLLFLGIALIVYAFFVKVIGVILFVVEIVYFILLPIWREVLSWLRMSNEIVRSKRFYVTLSCTLMLILVLVLPWSSDVDVFATIEQKETAAVYTPLPGKIRSHQLVEGRKVKKGDILAQLTSPDTEAEIVLSQKRIALLSTRLSRANAHAGERSLYLILKKELESEKIALQGLVAMREKLVVRAPVDGVLSNVDSEVHKGLWLNSEYRLALVRPSGQKILKGVVSQLDVARIQAGDIGRFIFNDGEFSSLDVKVAQIHKIALDTLQSSYLADVHGGRVPTVQSRQTNTGENSLKPQGSWFEVELELTGKSLEKLDQVRAGTAVLVGKKISIGSRILARIASVLIRELGI